MLISYNRSNGKFSNRETILLVPPKSSFWESWRLIFGFVGVCMYEKFDTKFARIIS